MNRRKLVSVFFALTLLSILSVGVAWADPPAGNPNANTLTNAVCEDGQTFDMVIVAAPSSVAAHVPGSTTVGIAKSIYYDPDGANILVLERGAQGNAPTVWCEWDSPEGHFGGEVLITPANW